MTVFRAGFRDRKRTPAGKSTTLAVDRGAGDEGTA